MATILLIEDDEPLRALLAHTLTTMGHGVVTAFDGAHGLKLVVDPAIQLVVTDVVMPGKNGIEVLIELKRLRPGMKVIAISGGGRIGAADYLIMAKHLGAAKTLQKPFTTEEPHAAVRELLPDPQEALSLAGG